MSIKPTHRSFHIVAAFDDDRTTAQVLTDDPFGEEVVVGTGKAKRRKGDPRNPELGLALASVRALRDAADRQQAFIDEQFK